MESPLNRRIEKDASQISTESSEIVRSPQIGEMIEQSPRLNRSLSQTVNNNMMLNQSNSSTVMTFNECSGLTFGSVINIVSQNKQKQVSQPREMNDESAYMKTPTIKEMLQCSDSISTAGFLDHICGNFGTRWRGITVLLKINQLFVDRMYEDYFILGGTKEVLFKVLTQFFKETNFSRKDEMTIGWFLSFLWYNGYKKTVWNSKEFYKKTKKIGDLF